MNIIFIANTIAGIVIVALAIFLIWEKVPPKGGCGIKTRKTLSDEKIWYAANKYFGKLFLIAGVLITITSIFLMLNDGIFTNFQAYKVIIFFTFASTFFSIILTLIYLKEI